MKMINLDASSASWTVDAVNRLMNEGAVLWPFNAAYMKIMRQNPVQAPSADPLNRLFQEGAPGFGSACLVPVSIARTAMAELAACGASESYKTDGRMYKAIARFRGRHHLSLASSYVTTHPGTTILHIVLAESDDDLEAIVVSSDDYGTPV